MSSFEYISFSLAGFIENIMSSMESTSVSDFMLDAISATHLGTSDEALGLEFSERSLMEKNKAINEIGKHLAVLAKTLYQLCLFCARIIIIAGKTLFDELDRMTCNIGTPVESNEPVRRKR